MIIKELIETLQQYNEDTIIHLTDYLGTDILHIIAIGQVTNANGVDDPDNPPLVLIGAAEPENVPKLN